MPKLNLSLRGTGESPSRLSDFLGGVLLVFLVVLTLVTNPPGRPARAVPATAVCAPTPAPTGGAR